MVSGSWDETRAIIILMYTRQKSPEGGEGGGGVYLFHYKGRGRGGII